VGKDGVRYNCTAAQRERSGRQRSEGVGPGRRTWRKASDRVANGWRATAVDDSVVRRGWRQRRLGAARAARRVCDATVAWADSAGPRALAGGTDEMDGAEGGRALRDGNRAGSAQRRLDEQVPVRYRAETGEGERRGGRWAGQEKERWASRGDGDGLREKFRPV
jgi:hypothetical protein